MSYGAGAFGELAYGETAGGSAPAEYYGDAVAWFVQDVACIGDVSAQFVQDVSSTGNTTANFLQAVADTGIAGALFAQHVAAVGDSVAWLDQAVDYPAGDTVAWLAQSVAGTGDAVAWIGQNVYSIAAVAASWANWDCSVRVNGVEQDNLIDSVRIEAERNAARTAEFTVALSGAVDVLSWVGRAVQIDYVQVGGARWRRFTGVIVEPVFDMSTRTLRCTCSDDLQRIIDGYSNAALQALTGGAWSEHVFNKDNVGWDYLQDLLETVPVSVEMDSNRVLRASSLNNKAAPDYEFDSLILDESLSADLVRRSGLINRVDLSFEAGFTRLYHRDERVSWRHSNNFCQNYAAPVLLPSIAMVQSAIEAAGWHFQGAGYDMIWPSGEYFCGNPPTPVYFTNNYPDGIRGFRANAAYRWGQNITAHWDISVTAPASIAAYGELASEASASASFDSTAESWGGADDNYSTIPAGFALDADGNYVRDEIDIDELNAALSTAVARAANTIAASHRSNRVTFALPLAPYLELHHTVQATDSVLTAKGIINKITETYSFREGDGSAITEIELALSSGQSGLDVIDSIFTAPSVPAQPVVAPTPVLIAGGGLPTYIGGTEDSAQYNEDWTGYLCNLEYPWPNAPIYPNELRIPFDAIPDYLTLNKTETITAEIAIAVPHNLLTITA